MSQWPTSGNDRTLVIPNVVIPACLTAVRLVGLVILPMLRDSESFFKE